MARRTTVMNVDVEGDEDINPIKDARSNACYKCGEVGHFQQDCKYDGDKPTDHQQAENGQPSPDSYDPVVGKWMTNLVTTTPITAKAMKNLYAELNKQKDLKRTYCKKYKDQQVMVTTAKQSVTVQQPIAVTGTKVKATPQAHKAVSGGKTKGATVKGKSKKPPIKGKANDAKSTTSATGTSAGPAMNTRAKTKDQHVVTIYMLQDLMHKLQTIEQESLDNEHYSEIT